MQETNRANASRWKRPLEGWRGLAAWALLFGCLAAVIRIVLGLTTEKFNGSSTGASWVLSIGIPLAAVLLLVLLVRCFSSWRNFKRFLFGLACLAALIALFYVVEDLRGRLAWARFKTQWEAKGEKFDFATFIPPSVPDEQNFAMSPVVATTYGQILDRNGRRLSPPNTNNINRLQMPLEPDNGGPTNGIGSWQKAITSNLEPWQRYYRNLSLRTNFFTLPTQPQTAAADVLSALSKYDETIEELRRAAALPGSRFPLNYDSEEPFAILLPHLAPEKGSAVVLRLRALAELEAGQTQMALADISLALSLMDKIRSEPFLISHLVRIAMFQITMQAVWEGLATHRWTEAQLSELEQRLAALDFLADYQAAMRGENACVAASMDYLRNHPDLVDRIGEFGENDPVRIGDVSSHLIPSGWFYQNELRSSKFILEQFRPIVDLGQQTVSPGLVKQADEALRSLRLTPYTVICRMLLPGLAHSAHKFAFAQTAVNLARVGCALERYRLAQGKYPETLEALIPGFIAKVPHDLIGGQPLHYRPTDGGKFILYSVGWNEKDDGGTVLLTRSGSVDLDNGDWVWRYPD